MPTSVHNRNLGHGNKTDGVPFPRQYFTDQNKHMYKNAVNCVDSFSKLYSWTRWTKKHCRKTQYCISRNKPCTNRKWFTEEARSKDIETSIGPTKSQEKLPTKNYRIFPTGSQHNFPKQTTAKINHSQQKFPKQTAAQINLSQQKFPTEHRIWITNNSLMLWDIDFFLIFFLILSWYVSWFSILEILILHLIWYSKNDTFLLWNLPLKNQNLRLIFEPHQIKILILINMRCSGPLPMETRDRSRSLAKLSKTWWRPLSLTRGHGALFLTMRWRVSLRQAREIISPSLASVRLVRWSTGMWVRPCKFFAMERKQRRICRRSQWDAKATQCTSSHMCTRFTAPPICLTSRSKRQQSLCSAIRPGLWWRHACRLRRTWGHWQRHSEQAQVQHSWHHRSLRLPIWRHCSAWIHRLLLRLQRSGLLSQHPQPWKWMRLLD